MYDTPQPAFHRLFLQPVLLFCDFGAQGICYTRGAAGSVSFDQNFIAGKLKNK